MSAMKDAWFETCEALAEMKLASRVIHHWNREEPEIVERLRRIDEEVAALVKAIDIDGTVEELEQVKLEGRS